MFKLKRNILIVLILAFIQTSILGQNEKNIGTLTNVGKKISVYHQDSRLSVPDSLFEYLSSINNVECQSTVDFFSETLREKNNLFSDKYLTKPDKQTLIQIYLVDLASGFSQFYKGEELENNVEYNSNNYPSYFELVDTYYSILFKSLSNRNRTTLFSKSNINLNDLKLENSTEKSIFYFRFIDALSKNVIIPILFDLDASEVYCSDFDNFPRIDNQNFYEYTNFDFKNFKSRITNFNGNYKHYIINEIYKIQIAYINCLENNFVNERNIKTVIENSILSKRELFKYCEKKDVLERISEKYNNE